MSATVLDVDSFCSSIGIDPKNVAYIKVPSTFPIKNRPINLDYCNVNLKYTNIDQGLNDLTDRVETILEMHKNDKGKNILDKIKIDHFIEIEDNAYDTIREMSRFLNEKSR